MVASEWLLASITLVSAAMYAVVARLQAQRRVSKEARGAVRGFVLWWAGLAAVAVFGVLSDHVLDMGSLSLAATRTVVYVLFLLILAMLAGLVHYLLYLYTGRAALMWVAIAFYAALMVFVIALVEAHSPYVGPDPETGERGLQLADEPGPLWAATLGVGLVAPPLAAAVAYAMLYFRTDDKTARYRIAMVSGAFVLWFGFSLAGTLGRLATGAEGPSMAAQVTSQSLGLIAALMTLLAYHPPRAWQRRWGLRPVTDVGGSPEPFSIERAPRLAPGLV